MNIDLSVIIPVHNGKEYLYECVDSIMHQNIKYMEVIIIDDGSTDGTLELLEKLKDSYPIKTIINKEQRGVSYSRNTGLRNATGRYVTFVDGDDVIDRDTYQDVLKMAEEKKADVICYPINRFKGSSVFPVEFKDENLCDNFIKYRVYMNSVCNKLFLRDYINRNGIMFDERLPVCEDFLFSFESMAKTNKIVYSTHGLYCYRVNEKSVTSNANNKCYINELKMVSESLELVCGKLDDDYNKLIKVKKLDYAILYLLNEKFFCIDRYREENGKKYYWVYPKWRIDLWLLTFFGNNNIRLPIYCYKSLRRILGHCFF